MARVKHGPYRALNHLIYVANVALLGAVTAMVPDVILIVSTLVVAALHAASARDEERALPK